VVRISPPHKFRGLGWVELGLCICNWASTAVCEFVVDSVSGKCLTLLLSLGYPQPFFIIGGEEHARRRSSRRLCPLQNPCETLRFTWTSCGPPPSFVPPTSRAGTGDGEIGRALAVPTATPRGEGGGGRVWVLPPLPQHGALGRPPAGSEARPAEAPGAAAGRPVPHGPRPGPCRPTAPRCPSESI